ncbi:hypothetical protein [Zobellia galactanivorans]|uniref:Poxvirus D5-like protein n=1 Tax=Zobellia galactanivorans (strain DSM 12802 / CCUG 47099 / CIP 106680 / NCIMB 13871 / Dsij) TaxID=63186 RepID=G0L487_ZOBGA|nr:hypothetical protein [Zobellia galactanivorans]CAZ98727.1 Poxvirus D5-like protein [Zobellia galactanivorans]
MNSSLSKIISDLHIEAANLEVHRFWKVKRNSKDPSKFVVLPNEVDFIEWLKSLGVCFEYATNSLVQEKNGIITPIEIGQLKHIVRDAILEMPDVIDEDITKDVVLNMIMANEARLFRAKGVLEFLPTKKFNWLRATKDTAYFPFNNCIVEVVKNDVKTVSYDVLGDRVIWKSQIIDRDFELLEPDGSDWADFIFHAAGGTQELVDNLNNALGYLLHDYKDQSNAFFTVFGESVDDSSKGGGAGKGLVSNALSYVVNTTFKDMRQFSPQDPFAWSGVTNQTKILVLSDLKKGFDHSILYNMVTDSIEVNRKNKPVEIIEFENSPKILASTNYSIDMSTGHGNRRLRLVEFAPYFNAEHTPVHKYGHLFFKDWNDEDWNKFYSYLFICVAQYLSKGFPRIGESHSAKKKRVLEAYGAADLYDWLAEYSTEGEYLPFSDVYIDYSSSRHVSKPMGKNIFSKRLNEVADLLEKPIDIVEHAKVKKIKICSTK